MNIIGRQNNFNHIDKIFLGLVKKLKALKKHSKREAREKKYRTESGEEKKLI